MRRIAVAALLVGLALAPGCVRCDPKTVDATVDLALAEEEVRTLPIQASGATQVAGIEVPDSHGRLEVNLSVSHPNISRVAIEDLTLQVTVNGSRVPVEVPAIGGGGDWEQADDGSWSGTAFDNGSIQVWWRVDRGEVAAVDEQVLPKGAPYEATVSFTWEHDGCDVRASGDVEQSFSDHVQASVDASTFQTRNRTVAWNATAAGFRAGYETTSGLVVEVDDVEARATFLAASPTGGGLGLVRFEDVGWNVSGEATSTVAPGDVLHVHSAAESGAGASYAASGTVVPPDLLGSRGLVVLQVTIRYEPQDPTVSAEEDRFAYGIVR